MGAPMQPQQPQPPQGMQPAATDQPVRHHVHHSYIWLESVRTLVIVAVAVVVANFSTIIGLVTDGDLGGFPVGMALALVAGASLVLILLVFGIVAVSRWVGY